MGNFYCLIIDSLLFIHYLFIDLVTKKNEEIYYFNLDL